MGDGPHMNIAQTIADRLGRRIIRGDLQTDGTTLIEQDIVSEFSASRNVVREAVKTLAGKNLVRSERRVGTIVQPPTEWNLLDPQVIQWMLTEEKTHDELLRALSEMRLIFEPEAAALAAERATSRQVLRIFDCFEEMKRHANDPEKAIEYDVMFHVAVLDACGNPLLRSLNQSISLLLRANFKLSIQVDNAFIRNLVDHGLIAEAIHEKSPERARQATIDLLKKNESDIHAIKAAGNIG